MSTRSLRAERDACGIGFVADQLGRSSRSLIDTALDGLCGVRHRGAVAADAKSGDGAGLMLPVPQRLLADWAATEAGAGSQGVDGRLGAAMCFLDGRDDAEGDRGRDRARTAVADALQAQGLPLLGWRTVPVEPTVVGDTARRKMPVIEQAVYAVPDGVGDEAAERHSYLARRRAERACRDAGVWAYFASWSTRTITYKAMSAADQLQAFYPDLADARVTGAWAIFHQRYSTNTEPAWERAQPFRFLCHNGEINTVDGNENLMRARVGNLGVDWPELLGDADAGDPAARAEAEELLQPLIEADNSDSAKLDNVLEVLTRGGRSISHAMAMLIPQVWEGRRDLASDLADFYRYHAALVEPWDGPAGVVFSDGRRVGAQLDRNGLRPLRYQVCDDGLVACASEVGAISTRGHGGVRRERLGPGMALLIDPVAGEGLIEDAQLKDALAGRRPYGEWVRLHQRSVGRGQPVDSSPEDLVRRQMTSGYTKEEQTTVLRPMASEGKEPISSMGDDTPIAVLAERPRTIYHYLKQRFAQVTNPPIDHLREWQVMSLRTQLGPRSPLLSEEPEAARLLELDGLMLYPQGLQELLLRDDLPFGVAGLDATFPVAEGADGLPARVRSLADEAVAAVRDGAGLLIVSDRSVDAERAPLPALVAVGAVHHRLVAEGLRTATSIVAETDDARETHTFACLLGYGADAICPRLALETIADLADNGRLGKDGSSAGEAQEAYRAAVRDGVMKIMSKMGISVLDSYRSAQIFEAVGLAGDVVDACLTGTPSRIGGIGLRELGEDVLSRHEAAYLDTPNLPSPGFYKFKRGGEYHVTNPDVIGALHQALGLEGDLEPIRLADEEIAGLGPDQVAARLHAIAADPDRAAHYAQFARLVNGRAPTEPRDLVEPVPAVERGGEPVPLAEVEPATSIVQRFFTGAMSLGALSPESHEDLAVAMNWLGGASNCGEGGEDPERFATRGTSRDRNSHAKQVASGRFGVTPTYLAYADEHQIKIAQGSKPGEGGQIPGHKVTELIARLRHTQPGVPLVSPPPHHDIYSIEDLAQLIYDLKQVNPLAGVNVKLVACDGVGTVAAGVVKGLADKVQIAGADGGTGASPLSSIKHAGLPWELGVAETQRTLVEEGLRSRARLQVDGGFKTGRDVVQAALLGADEYGFGTIALIAQGCIMARACHRDTCPVGIATQRRELRDKYAGTAEMVAVYLLQVAEEVREHLAALGLRSLDEAIGQVELLRERAIEGPARAHTADPSVLLLAPDADADAPRTFVAPEPIQAPRGELGDRVFADAFESIWDGTLLNLKYAITNVERTVGARLGGAIGLEFGDPMLGGMAPPGKASVRFSGAAGQSFGAFLADGVEFQLDGEANDYVGKGMGGGRVVIRPPADDAGNAVLAGNTCLYGATGGELFVAGRAGERFAVRNSGADAVVEGVGEHACEYMTGGTVVVLGPTGFNLGAGMTGGECFVLDESAEILARINGQLVEGRRPDGRRLARVHALVARHAELTGSRRARELLDNWEERAADLWCVAPRGAMSQVEQAGTGKVPAPA